MADRLQEIRDALRDRLRIATTVARARATCTRPASSTRAGRTNGLFIQITGDDADDLAIPGAGYGFSTLKAAQALGDLQALRDGRRAGSSGFTSPASSPRPCRSSLQMVEAT